VPFPETPVFTVPNGSLLRLTRGEFSKHWFVTETNVAEKQHRFTEDMG